MFKHKSNLSDANVRKVINAHITIGNEVFQLKEQIKAAKTSSNQDPVQIKILRKKRRDLRTLRECAFNRFYNVGLLEIVSQKCWKEQLPNGEYVYESERSFYYATTGKNENFNEGGGRRDSYQDCELSQAELEEAEQILRDFNRLVDSKRIKRIDE